MKLILNIPRDKRRMLLSNKFEHFQKNERELSRCNKFTMILKIEVYPKFYDRLFAALQKSKFFFVDRPWETRLENNSRHPSNEIQTQIQQTSPQTGIYNAFTSRNRSATELTGQTHIKFGNRFSHEFPRSTTVTPPSPSSAPLSTKFSS